MQVATQVTHRQERSVGWSADASGLAAAAAAAAAAAPAGSGEVWAAGSNVDGQLGLGLAFGAKNAEFRLVKALQGELTSQ
jgi:hypothetical protein